MFWLFTLYRQYFCHSSPSTTSDDWNIFERGVIQLLIIAGDGMQKLHLTRLGAGTDVHRAISAVAQDIQTMVFADKVQGDLMRMLFIRPQKKVTLSQQVWHDKDPHCPQSIEPTIDFWVQVCFGSEQVWLDQRSIGYDSFLSGINHSLGSDAKRALLLWIKQPFTCNVDVLCSSGTYNLRYTTNQPTEHGFREFNYSHPESKTRFLYSHGVKLFFKEAFDWLIDWLIDWLRLVFI